MDISGISSTTDYFALFDEPRRFWLDADLLKQKFMARSAALHPDHASSPERSAAAAPEDFTAFNAAYQCLRNPRTRLQHLIELETGSRPRQIETVPPELMNLFFKVADKCRQADALLARKASSDSPLLQVGIFEVNQECAEQLLQLKQQIGAQMDTLLANVRQLDARWPAAGAKESERLLLLEEAASICRLLGYFERWTSQLQERMLQLTF